MTNPSSDPSNVGQVGHRHAPSARISDVARGSTSGRRSPARVGNVTLEDVARVVGVSARTVSRVVNDEGGCTPETRERILAAIEEVGYRPNLMARGLIRRRSDTIGLVTAEMLDPFFPEFADGVQRASEGLGRTMFLANTNVDRARQSRALTSLQGHGVDGVIVFPAAGTEPDLINVAADGLPIVVVNTEIDAPNIAVVTNDIRGGGLLAVDHLVARGRRRIALLIDVTARRHTSPSRREAGYRAALAAAGIPFDESLVVEAPNSLDGGRQGARELLARDVRPDAVFAYNDLMALGAMQELLTSGIRVPDDVAVVGFDDISMCEAVTPRLTSVRIDRDLLGRTAVEQLQALLEHPGDRVPPIHLPVSLVIRESS
jgi:LacI family transcriptional regulator